MDSELIAWLKSAPRLLHARGMEGAEWLGCLLIGSVSAGGFGYNLFQLLWYGRFYIDVRQGPNYWAEWPADRGVIIPGALLSLLWFAIGVVVLTIVVLYPITLMLWGPHRAAYRDKPPLSLSGD